MNRTELKVDYGFATGRHWVSIGDHVISAAWQGFSDEMVAALFDKLAENDLLKARIAELEEPATRSSGSCCHEPVKTGKVVYYANCQHCRKSIIRVAGNNEAWMEVVG